MPQTSFFNYCFCNIFNLICISNRCTTKFLNYYLPTSLKLLNTYAELDAQGINGSNISQSKREIEATMDTLCDAFAAQLDKLFTSDAMDVSADIAAMQAMLAQDGLTDSDFNLPV